MASELVYASRVRRLPLVDADGATLGRIDDVVLVPGRPLSAPRVLGFVAIVQRRRIFINGGKVGEVDAVGVRLRSSTVDLRHFELRSGEVLTSTLLDRQVGDEVVADLALRRTTDSPPVWEVATVALAPAGRGTLRRRRAPRVVVWRDVPSLWEMGDLVPRELADYRDMHPSDVANAVRALPLERRRQLADAMEDERLADLLEELPEDEQLRLIEGLDVERLAHVLAEMAPDDAADLLAEMTGEQRGVLLEAMPADEAAPLRRLLRYGEHTAGGLMTPEPIIVPAGSPVAEALARLRDPDLAAALAAQVYVVEPPTTTPTGRYIGTVGFQRLLREPPYAEVGRSCGEEPPTVGPGMPEAEVAAHLAAYNMLAVAVTDEAGRLLGAVSIDDVLDAVLPEDWRAAVVRGA